MMELFPYLSPKKAKWLDRKIKVLIAWDDREEYILSYVKKVLKEIKKSDYTFNPHCESLAEKYRENNDKIVCQENLFCFLGLIASVLILVADLLLSIFPCEWLGKVFEPLVVYPCALILFCIMIKNDWVYRKNEFNDFLKLLSRNSSGLSFVSSACFCVLFSSGVDSAISVCALALCALMPCFALTKSYRQWRQK